MFVTNAAVCSKRMQCLRNKRSGVFETKQCSPEANTELHSDQEVLVTEQDNFSLKVSRVFMAV